MLKGAKYMMMEDNLTLGVETQCNIQKNNDVANYPVSNSKESTDNPWYDLAIEIKKMVNTPINHFKKQGTG